MRALSEVQIIALSLYIRKQVLEDWGFAHGWKMEIWDSNPAILPYWNTETLVKENAKPCSEFFLLLASFSTLGSSLAKLSYGFQLNHNLKDLLFGQSPPQESGWLQEDHSLKGLPPAPAVALCPGSSNQH